MVLLQKTVNRTSVRAARIKHQWDSLSRKSLLVGVPQDSTRHTSFRSRKRVLSSSSLLSTCSSDTESNSSSGTLGFMSQSSSVSNSSINSMNLSDHHDSSSSHQQTTTSNANQFFLWAKSIMNATSLHVATTPNQKACLDIANVNAACDDEALDDEADIYAPLAYSEKCHECHRPFVLIEHSGVLKCTNVACIANGRRITVVDGDMASLPFGADISYKSMSLARDDLQLCESDRSVVHAHDVSENVELLPSSTSLFNSLLKGCATSTNGYRCGAGENHGRVASDGSCTLSCNDAHFKHLCVVFGYSASNKAHASIKALTVKNPYMEEISPSLVVYVQTCLCKSICGVAGGGATHDDCKWRQANTSLNYTELSHLLSRLAKDSDDAEWKRFSKKPSFIANLLSQLIDHVPVAPSESELSQACQYFVVARRAKDEEFVLSKTKPKPFKAGFAWYKIWQMMHPFSKTQHFFPMPSNLERLKSLDQWWHHVCEIYRWQYYPTAKPNIASKMSVRLASAEEF